MKKLLALLPLLLMLLPATASAHFISFPGTLVCGSAALMLSGGTTCDGSGLHTNGSGGFFFVSGLTTLVYGTGAHIFSVVTASVGTNVANWDYGNTVDNFSPTITTGTNVQTDTTITGGTDNGASNAQIFNRVSQTSGSDIASFCFSDTSFAECLPVVVTPRNSITSQIRSIISQMRGIVSQF